MKQIIVPTDFSQGAWNALIYATNLGEALGVRDILVLNSYIAPHSGASTLVSIDRIMQQDSENGLEEWAAKIKNSGLSTKFNFHTKSVHANLVEALSSQVTDYNETMIVMGSLGETGKVEKLFGSNASNVALDVNCPLVVVPPNSQYTNLRDIVLGSDFDLLGENNLKILKQIDDLDPSTNLKIVHVTGKDEAQNTPSNLGIDQKLLPHSLLDIPGDNIGDALDTYVSSNQTDLLVLVKRKKGFFGSFFGSSVTKKMTLMGHVPLLILKEV